MTITVLAAERAIHNLETRMPFHYGIASMIAVPHLFVRLACDVDGRTAFGLAADSLIPKWFTKDPHTLYRDDLADMFDVIEAACDFALHAARTHSVFALWQQVYAAQQRWASARGFPPLLWNFAVSLVERAVMDAFCRALGITFSQALLTNAFGIHLGDLHPELSGCQPADLLPAQPLDAIHVRHTVGLVDPLTDQDIPDGKRLHDGLPQSLQACIRAYGLAYFKIKVSGEVARDADRLCRINAVLDRCGISDYHFTLDGNEQYTDVRAFRAFWEEISADSACAPYFSRLLFVEQPFHRDVALSEETCSALRQWHDRPAMIIDESDGLVDSLRIALDSGYAGTSHKNCKGVIKGIANACLLARRKAGDPPGVFILSGEDLANVGPVALLQDLAVMANLGIQHVERNGHHYFAGLSMFPAEIQRQVLAQHADLYHFHDRGFAKLGINRGKIALHSLLAAPFGSGVGDISCHFTPQEEWSFDSLGLS